MPDVKAIEEAIRALPPHDLAAFRQWFNSFDAAAWDHQIESDLADGKLTHLLDEAEADLQAGDVREL